MDTIRGIRRVLWVTMLLNLVATSAKLIVGYITGSLALIADGFDSVFDSASNVIGLVGLRVASRPPDAEHPYGHRKAETMTALIISLLLFVTAWELAKSAVERLRNPSLIRAEANIWSFGALLVSILVHTFVVWYEMREGRRLRSDVLVADAQHTRADIFVSLSVVGGLIAVRLGFPLADPILALLICAIIVKIGVDIIRESVPTLMDRTVLPVDEVERIASGVPGVISCHQVRSRGHGAAVYADLHIQVDPAMSTEQAHALAHEVQDRLRQRRTDVQDVTVHVEPSNSPINELPHERIATRLRRLADGLGLTVHDVWAYRVGDKYYAEAHLEADGSLSLDQAHALASQLEQRARSQLADLAELAVHIEPRGRLMQSPQPGMQEAELAELVRRLTNELVQGETCHRIQAHPGQQG